MRFVEKGPILPDELLTARDEGQVIFFCGSGVSMARAGLPDFYGLADAVLEQLHAASNSLARAVITASKAIKVRGIEGLIPADRAFSILEQEFDVLRVRTAVAESLTPKSNDLTAHQALIDLSRGTDGQVRLVTTNFDRLFESCDPDIACHAPPDLPNPGRSNTFKGIMHLHGVLDAEGLPPIDEEFVISTADFGRAYLAEGWATRFIRSLMERYQIVFIGYTANDPPVQYLLEALNTRSATFQPMYAFQAGDDDLASALWQHKGVRPISFDPANNYAALWDTLFAWADRARDPETWLASQLARAADGPRQLKAHERGIIAHIASYSGGARYIAKRGASLPGEWLCVFDPELRYRNPSSQIISEAGSVFDPFVIWGLDDDEIPPPIDLRNRYQQRKVPGHAKSVLAANRLDEGISARSANTRPSLLDDPSYLPDRLRFLGTWLTQISHEPVALWWASGKPSLHPYLHEWLPRALSQEPGRFSDLIRRGWRDLLASRSRQADPHDLAFYELENRIKADGWSPPVVRELARMRTPYLAIERSWVLGAPPDVMDDPLSRRIRYPNAGIKFELPSEWLELFQRELGNALERAIDLELEQKYSVFMLGPLWRQEQTDSAGEIGDDLTTLFRDWVATLESLLANDPELVRSEMPRWLRRSDEVSTRLKIWTVWADGLLSNKEAGHQIITLDDAGFWDRDHQRDLLHALATRWPTLRPNDRVTIENRTRSGPPRYEGETEEMHSERSAAYALDRLHWLNQHGCSFSFDFAAEIARLRALCQEWSEPGGDAAADSIEIKVQTVSERKEFSELLGIPIKDVAAAAAARDYQRIDPRTVSRSFRGLSSKQPVRALAALRHAAAPPSPRLWEDYLQAEDRAETSTRLAVATACVLASMTPQELATLLRPVARWLEQWEAKLATDAPDIEARLWSNMLDGVEQTPDSARSGVITTGGKHDWLLEAINAPTGILADLAVHSASAESPKGKLPPRWTDRLRRLVQIDGDVGRYAVVTTNQNLSFMHGRAKRFTEQCLLPFRNGDNDDRAAFWTGVFRTQNLSANLHRVLNDDIIGAARQAGGDRSETEPLSALLLRGWALDVLRDSGDAISADTVRETILDTSDEFRRQLLNTVRRWWPEVMWQPLAIEFLSDVWPRQRAARSASVIDAIAAIIVNGDDRFPDLLAAAGDLLEPLPGMTSMWSYNSDRLESLARRFPDAMLEFLFLMLAEDAADWPYRVETVLEVLEESEVAKDGRLQELRRRWTARGN